MSTFENRYATKASGIRGGCRPAFARRLLLMLAFIAAQFAVATAVFAQTYYVRAGAQGSNSGSDWTNAYTNLPSSLVRGATYYVAGGSYGARTFRDATSSTAVITIKKATVADHGTTTGWQDTYGSTQAVFGNLAFNTGYYVFDGVTGGGPGSWETGFGFKVQGCYHTIDFPASVANIAIRHTDIQGCGRLETSDTDLLYLVYKFTNISVSYCFLHDVSRTMILTWPAAGSGFTLEYSKLARNGTAEHREAWSAGPDSNVIVRNNLFEDIFGTGFIAIVNNNGDASNWQIYGNVFYHTGRYTDGIINTGAIMARYDGSSGPISVRAVNWQIHNNSFINVLGYTAAIVLQSTTGSYAYNNVWYKNQGTTGIDNRNGMIADYNWFYANGANGQYAAHDTVGSANPFVNWQGGDFRLTAALPGQALATQYSKDPLNVTRGGDGVWDRGAYEFGGTPSLGAPSNLRVVPQ